MQNYRKKIHKTGYGLIFSAQGNVEHGRIKTGIDTCGVEEAVSQGSDPDSAT
jgi:hypothetical protein